MNTVIHMYHSLLKYLDPDFFAVLELTGGTATSIFLTVSFTSVFGSQISSGLHVHVRVSLCVF